MLTRENLTKLLQGRLPYLAAEFGVERIGLFGSYAKDAPTEDSDVDIVAEFGRHTSLK